MPQDAAFGWLKPAATICALIALVLVLVNAVLVLRDQSYQAVLNQRQQLINQAVMLARVDQAIAQSIVRAELTSKDPALAQLMERHGIKINPPPESAAPGTGGKP